MFGAPFTWICAAAAAVLLSAAPAPPRDAVAAESSYPRFASLRASRANMRTGPGRRYPILWVFVRRGLPIQIIGAFETWRRVRDWEGTEGWMHQSLLSTRQSVIVVDGPQPLRGAPMDAAGVIARVERRVVGRPLDCDGVWCEAEFQGRRGWIRRHALWGGGRGGE